MSLLPLFLLLLTLLPITSLTRATTCTTPPLQSTTLTYTHCTPLPSLSSTLHWVHTPSNHTLSVAFTAIPPSPTGWVAWGINPTSTGMAGTQAILAYKSSNGSMITKTLNISSYSDLKEGKLSFEVHNKSAVFNSRDGSITVFATVEYSGSKLNQVWQVGPGVDNDGFPKKHEFKTQNLNSRSTLDLNSGGDGSGKVEDSKSNGGVHKRIVASFIICFYVFFGLMYINLV